MYAIRMLDRENVGDGWPRNCADGGCRFAIGFRGIAIMLERALKGGDCRLGTEAVVLDTDEGAATAIEL
jgi:hypothetical protein